MPPKDRATVTQLHDSEPYKAANQLRKAKKLAGAALALGIDHEHAERLGDQGRQLLEKAAGVDANGPSSDTTWGMVFVLLEG